MKLVKEHIEQFTRGENPFKTLNIGKRVEIKNWFKTWAPRVKYEIDEDLNIKVKRSLWFRGMNITSLLNNLYIEESLDLEGTKITFLPDDLYVGEYLNINGTKITSLPDNLHVGGFLDLKNTKITSLPDDLIVVGNIYKDF